MTTIYTESGSWYGHYDSANHWVEWWRDCTTAEDIEDVSIYLSTANEQAVPWEVVRSELGLSCKCDETPPATIGWGPWRKDWYKICGVHGRPTKGCSACRTGHYINRWRHFLSHCVFWLAPGLWRQWVNRA